MKQKSNNQKFHPAVGILGGLTILMGILFMDEKIGVPLSIVSGITTMSGLILMGHVPTDYWATWAYSWALLLISLGLFFITLRGFDVKQYDSLFSKGTDSDRWQNRTLAFDS